VFESRTSFIILETFAIGKLIQFLRLLGVVGLPVLTAHCLLIVYAGSVHFFFLYINFVGFLGKIINISFQRQIISIVIILDGLGVEVWGFGKINGWIC
jgi:hypothetical protein